MTLKTSGTDRGRISALAPVCPFVYFIAYQTTNDPLYCLCISLDQCSGGTGYKKVNILVYHLDRLDSGIVSYNLTPIPCESTLTILPVILVGVLEWGKTKVMDRSLLIEMGIPVLINRPPELIFVMKSVK